MDYDINEDMLSGCSNDVLSEVCDLEEDIIGREVDLLTAGIDGQKYINRMTEHSDGY